MREEKQDDEYRSRAQMAAHVRVAFFRTSWRGFSSGKAQTYSVDSVPGPEIVKRYLDGSAVKQFDFVLASREFFGDSIGQNADNLQWYEEFSAWVAQQNRRPKHLPELMPGRRAQKVEVTTSGYPFQMTSEGKARYQIQLKMTYFEKGAR